MGPIMRGEGVGDIKQMISQKALWHNKAKCLVEVTGPE